MNDYYVIKKQIEEDDSYSWDPDPYTVYLCGKYSEYYWVEEEIDARKFKSISEIRTFITNSMKDADLEVDHASWIFHRISTIPCSEVFTAVHTMSLLRSVI